jgi:putative heme iron utilization protein
MAGTKPIRSRKTSTAAKILGRLIMPKKSRLSPDAARSILELRFQSADQVKVDRLSAKAREGSLTPAERAELEEYIRVADLLAMLKSKARLSLKKAGLDADVS